MSSNNTVQLSAAESTQEKFQEKESVLSASLEQTQEALAVANAQYSSAQQELQNLQQEYDGLVTNKAKVDAELLQLRKKCHHLTQEVEMKSESLGGKEKECQDVCGFHPSISMSLTRSLFVS